MVKENGPGSWGYINKTGKLVIEPKYETAEPCSEGLALVSEPVWKRQYLVKWQYLDADGRPALWFYFK